MAQFEDKSGQSWSVNLDPVIAMEVQEKHQVELANLETDPMLKLRSNPMTLVSVLHLMCSEQIKARDLSPTDFAKALPFPPDAMLSAVSEAIVSFFPTGRASHVAGVLAGYEKMGTETDELTTEKLQKLLDNPATMQRISEVADQEIERAMQSLSQTVLQRGTSSTAAEIAST